MTTEQIVEIINVKVTSILTLIKGNELDRDDKGMVGTQNDHEERISRLEAIIDKGKYFIYGITIPAAWGIADMFKRLF